MPWASGSAGRASPTARSRAWRWPRWTPWGSRCSTSGASSGRGCSARPQLTSRAPTEAEWEEIRAGWRLARDLASRGIGQTVVRARGVTVAVEAAEGTDETIRRGVRLSGPGAVVIKAVADDHDFRFDVPAVGLATLEAMATGGATALAVARGRTLLVDGDAVMRRAEDAGIAVVTLEDGA